MPVRTYETVIALAETQSQEQIDELGEKLQKLLKKHKAESSTVVPWGKRKLAYDIDGNKHAHYIFLQYVAPGAAVGELEHELRLDKAVIRFHTFLDHQEPKEGEFHFKNPEVLVTFITDRGKIRPARTTKLSAPIQRKLTREIKRARMLGLLPFTTGAQ